jgi:hypothetical protein
MKDIDDHDRLILGLKGDAIHREPVEFILKPDSSLYIHVDGGECGDTDRTFSPAEVKQLRGFLEKEPGQIEDDSELVRFAKANRLSFATSMYGVRFDSHETSGSLRIRRGIGENRASISLSAWIKADCPPLANASDDGQPWSVEHLEEE